MDNVTHSLVGLLAGEACLLAMFGQRQAQVSTTTAEPAGVAERHGRFRTLVLATSIVANNFPDLDFAYVPITWGKLGYLLHHRGHTHTFLFAWLQSLIIFGLAFWWARRRKIGLNNRQTACLALVAGLGTMLHIGFDFSNSYGVHPFWPLDNHWYYKDALFIIEPYLIVAICACLVWSLKTKLAKGILFFFIFGVLALVWVRPEASLVAAQAVTVVALLLLWLAYAWSPRGRVQAAALACFLAGLVFFTGSRTAGAMATDGARTAVMDEVKDVIVSPQPANPICYETIIVGTSRQDYVLATATVSVLPEWISGKACRRQLKNPTLPLEPLGVQAGGLYLNSMWKTPLDSLRQRFEADCNARAFLRFARAPYMLESSSGFTVGDLRYDREPGAGFAELVVPNGTECPRLVPPWERPRGDLFPER